MTMPRMLILEALAQTSGALIRDLGDGASRSIGYFIGADRVRMRRDARPGETLLLDLTLEQWRRGVCRTRGVATVAGEIILTASLTTIVRAAG
jgi:3-hydroxyacyl-[acyl-carrier-protein] dehydratase